MCALPFPWMAGGLPEGLMVTGLLRMVTLNW